MYREKQKTAIYNPKIVAGNYKEDAAVMNATSYYMIRLPIWGMTCPRLRFMPYFGTIEQITRLVMESTKLDGARYAPVCAAFVDFLAGNANASYRIGNHREWLMTQVSEVCRAEYLLDGVSWTTEDKERRSLKVTANSAQLDMVLLRHGNRLYRCTHYQFEGFKMICFDKDWGPYIDGARISSVVLGAGEERNMQGWIYIMESGGENITRELSQMKQKERFDIGGFSRELLVW